MRLSEYDSLNYPLCGHECQQIEFGFGFRPSPTTWPNGIESPVAADVPSLHPRLHRLWCNAPGCRQHSVVAGSGCRFSFTVPDPGEPDVAEPDVTETNPPT